MVHIVTDNSHIRMWANTLGEDEVDKTDPARLTVLIWGDDRGRFPSAPESMYAGKTLRVTGTVKMYEGAAEIVVSDPGAIVVVE